MVAVAILLLAGIAMTALRFDDEEAVRGGTGTVNSSRVGTSTNANPSLRQQEELDRYNTEALPEIQKENPTAHPMLLTSRSDKPENPFATQEELKRPDRVSETGRTESTAQGQRSQQEGTRVDTKGADELVKRLVELEGNEKPSLYAVEFQYASPQAVANNNRNSLSGEPSTRMAAEDGSVEPGGIVGCRNPVIRAGSIVVATTDFALNSDVGGPVSLTIANGKLRGHQLIGGFERKEEWLRMDLTKIVAPTETMKVQAIGLDMNTALNAVDGHVDRHIVYRYGWWGVGTVLKAIGAAAEANSNRTVVVSDGYAIESTRADSSREIMAGLGSLGEDLGGVMQDRLNRPITVTKKVNEEVGVYFMSDVCASSTQENY